MEDLIIKSQEEVEVFNKTIRYYLSDCYEYDKIDNIEWDLKLTVSGFSSFIIRRDKKNTTTIKIPDEILKSIMIQKYEKRLWWRQHNLVRDI